MSFKPSPCMLLSVAEEMLLELGWFSPLHGEGEGQEMGLWRSIRAKGRYEELTEKERSLVDREFATLMP